MTTSSLLKFNIYDFFFCCGLVCGSCLGVFTQSLTNLSEEISAVQNDIVDSGCGYSFTEVLIYNFAKELPLVTHIPESIPHIIKMTSPDCTLPACIYL